MPRLIETIWLYDDGLIPNNATLPVSIYRDLPTSPRPDRAIERLFHANGWSNAWVNGIYPFHHYHATVHEVLGIAAGSAHVKIGGPSGPTLELSLGDAILIPAGVGHCRISATPDLAVVGAYPEGAEPDLVRGTPEARLSAIPLILTVPRPRLDPVLGVPYRSHTTAT